MMTKKFQEKMVTELIDYISLRINKLKNKGDKGDSIIDENGFCMECGYRIIDGKTYSVLTFLDNREYREVPHYRALQEFFYMKEISEKDWEFVKWCLDGVEEFLKHLYSQAKENEEKIENALKESDAYQEYKSLKVIEKLEKEG